MSVTIESARLIAEMYDLRREKVLRKARKWIMTTYNPTSADEIMETMMSEEKEGSYLSMVISYWDMVASFVNYGAIDEKMFGEITGEHIFVFAKIEPYLAELRAKFDYPEMYMHLEKLIMGTPEGVERLRKTQQWLQQAGQEEAKSA